MKSRREAREGARRVGAGRPKNEGLAGGDCAGDRGVARHRAQVQELDGEEAWAVFDRPAGSERDLVVLAEATGAVIVQRHPSGSVRIVGEFGVFRWNGLRWRHEPLVSAWFDIVNGCTPLMDANLLETLIEFAVHDLGARGIGATLVFFVITAGFIVALDRI